MLKIRRETDAERQRESRRLLLAIDTSTDQVGIALFDGRSAVERLWFGGREGTTQLLPTIGALLQSSGRDIREVGAIAIATGPGTFTGLRVGMSVAKGFVLASSRTLIGIPTLSIAATPYRIPDVSMVVALPAGRDRIVWTRCSSGHPIGDPLNSSLDELLRALRASPGTTVVADLSATAVGKIAEVANVISGAAAVRRPGVLAELGWMRWEADDVDDAATLQPVYLHGRRPQVPR